jgi:hydrogenase nickel incorporation protein HypA/HybF
MHEMSITQGVVDICESHAEGRRVTSVTLEIGDLSGVVPDAVEFCFDACTRGTPLEGACLIIERVPARGRCHGCGVDFALAAYFDPCPACGSYGVEFLSGEELRVKELEVE